MPGYEQLSNVLNAIKQMPPGVDSALPEIFFEKHYPEGSFFVKAGEHARYFGFVVKGLFRYFYVDMEGKERIKTFVKENEFVVSYASLITGTESAYYIEALEDSVVLQVDREPFLDGVEHDAFWGTISRKCIERLFVEKIRREASFLMEDAMTRYETFVSEHGDLHNRLRLKDIASYLGMTDVSLSRLRRIRS